jgi:hypothetical protein
MTNARVVELSKTGLDDEIIIAKINGSEWEFVEAQ